MNPLVSTAWLSERLSDPTTVVFDATLPPVGVKPPVDTRARYLAEHIPGAFFFDIEALSDRSTSLPHMLPAAEAFSSAMSAMGLNKTSTICIYEQEGVFSAPRAWWMLRTFGAREVYILDGGLRAWKEAGLPLSSGPEQPRAPGNFDAVFQPDAVKNFDQIQQLIAKQAQILDARSAARFSGAIAEPRPGLSSGHMPGATSLPYTELVENGCMKPAGDLRTLFAEKKVDIAQPITTTCGSGVTAAVIVLALEIAGAPVVSLYDGSWSEYAQQPEAKIEKSS
jgi:thiosulfate/3-mercaptopyruvate sulfurtransferase